MMMGMVSITIQISPHDHTNEYEVCSVNMVHLVSAADIRIMIILYDIPILILNLHHHTG